MKLILQTLPRLIDEMPDDLIRTAIVVSIWPGVLGEHLRHRTVVNSFDNGVLMVTVSSTEWKREFEEHAAEIVFKLNRTLGSSLVRRIELNVDRHLVEKAHRETVRSDKLQEPASLPNVLKDSSTKIVDHKLRRNFLEAAAACIELRDAY
jgi:hypothetical protein